MNGTDMQALGLKKEQIGIALKLMNTWQRRPGVYSETDMIGELKRVIATPGQYQHDEDFGPLAYSLSAEARLEEVKLADRLGDVRPYAVFGREMIQQAAIDQMDVAMSLPVSRRGALMPDAHKGYGLPIGGVLETQDAVIPYAVGVDIGCSIKLSVLRHMDAGPETFTPERRAELGQLLIDRGSFGRGCEGFGERHAVLDDVRWAELPRELRHLRDVAVRQLGSQGGGNHFIEWGTHVLSPESPEPELALLSHFGSRGVGAQIAAHFTALAERQHPHLPAEAKKLAWLEMGSESGQAYWDAMELAAAFAKAGHDLTHARLLRDMKYGYQTYGVFNTHNLAWKQENGRVIHRKGATPAHKGQVGIIPSSMATPAYIVNGLGNEDALLSASHGAGRTMGRKEAERTLNPETVRAYLEARGITKIGAGLDEAPGAYKDGAAVMDAQSDLVEIKATFQPVVVRMASDDFSED